jgi:hypothetical protein
LNAGTRSTEQLLVFYANIAKIYEPYGFTTYMGGQTIVIRMKIIAQILRLNNNPILEEAYVTYSWSEPPEQSFR